MPQLVTVPFRGDTLFAVHQPDGIFVAVKPIADRLGVDWSGQRQRIERSPVLKRGRAVISLPSPGGPQDTLCLRLDLINGWLFGIDANRVKPEIQPAVIAYQEECFSVLYKHFFAPKGEGVIPSPLPHPAREESMRVRRQLVTEARHVFGERAAGGLWFALGLPEVPEMREAALQGSFPFMSALPVAAPMPPAGPASGEKP